MLTALCFVFGIFMLLVAKGMNIYFCYLIGTLLVGYGVFRCLPIQINKSRRNSAVACGTHLSGLPVGEMDCRVYTLDDFISFVVGKNNYDLRYTQIIAAEMRDKNQLSGSSLGSAVAGAAFFGVLGAIIASRPKNKKEHVMIISYISNDGQQRNIGISFTDSELLVAEKVLNVIQSNITTSNSTML